MIDSIIRNLIAKVAAEQLAKQLLILERDNKKSSIDSNLSNILQSLDGKILNIDSIKNEKGPPENIPVNVSDWANQEKQKVENKKTDINAVKKLFLEMNVDLAKRRFYYNGKM